MTPTFILSLGEAAYGRMMSESNDAIRSSLVGPTVLQKGSLFKSQRPSV